MKGIFSSILVLGIVVVSCTTKNGSSNNGNDKSELTIREFYQSKMKEKNFQFVNNGPSDDALEDTIHERSIAYFDSKTYSDSNAIVEFKFIDACCQKFLGDYQINNDTLTFQLEQVNDEMCSCLCWYRYKLTLNEHKENFSTIEVKID